MITDYKKILKENKMCVILHGCSRFNAFCRGCGYVRHGVKSISKAIRHSEKTGHAVDTYFIMRHGEEFVGGVIHSL